MQTPSGFPDVSMSLSSAPSNRSRSLWQRHRKLTGLFRWHQEFRTNFSGKDRSRGWPWRRPTFLAESLTGGHPHGVVIRFAHEMSRPPIRES
jgi:hypothetical protein